MKQTKHEAAWTAAWHEGLDRAVDVYGHRGDIQWCRIYAMAYADGKIGPLDGETS